MPDRARKWRRRRRLLLLLALLRLRRLDGRQDALLYEVPGMEGFKFHFMDCQKGDSQVA